MNGATPTSEVLVRNNPGSAWHLVGVGNYNGNTSGQSDLLWQYENASNASDPNNGQASIWMMNGTTPTSEVLVGSNPGSSWHINS
jgi:hypothetical protein